MGNTLTAFRNILEHPLAPINPAKISTNRINNVGDALEGFLKDIYADTNNDTISDSKKDEIYNKVFSWLGNSSNPPDFILRGGDAVEVKKINKLNPVVALNSSYPKSKLHFDDNRIAPTAKLAEQWDTKDIVYAIGSTPNNELKRLWLIYGDCYAASREVYQRVVGPIRKASRAVYRELGFELEVETNEIAKFNKVDPLGITDLRVRGMWHIKNPSRIFENLTHASEQRQYYLLMREAKYAEFPTTDRTYLEQYTTPGYLNRVITIRNPDNPAKLMDARFISYEL